MPHVSNRTAIITIASDDDLSAAIPTENREVGSLYVPILTSCNLTFVVSNDRGVTYKTLKTAAGAAVTITATTGDFYLGPDVLAPLNGFTHVKIATSVAQAANRSFVFGLVVEG